MKGSFCFPLVLGVAVAVGCSFMAVPASAQSQPLPDAGQRFCYDDINGLISTICHTIMPPAMPPCPWGRLEGDQDCSDAPATCPGQDAAYNTSLTGCELAGRYVIDNGGLDDVPPAVFDDVVKDTCTNLMWTRAMGDLTDDGIVDLWGSDDDDQPWENALAFCEELVLTVGNGFKVPSINPLDLMDPNDDIRFDDWRLANVREMLSIVRWDSDPHTDTTVWFGSSTGMWTSTSRVDAVPQPGGQGTVSRVWIQENRNGHTSFAGVKTGGAGTHPVRTMLPGDAAAGGGRVGGGGAGGGGAGGGGAGGGSAARGAGAGAPPACTDDNGNGNVNEDLDRDLSDAVSLLSWLFQGGPAPKPFCTPAGPKEEMCAVENGNTNGDLARDLSDVIYLLAWLFQGGPPPVPKCGGPPVEEICDGLGVDEDLDGATDCDDPDCIGQVGCPGAEICTGGFDEDGDGATDCTDQDCAQDVNCQVAGGTGLPDTGQRTCYNGVNSPVNGAQAEIPCPSPGQPFYGQDGSHDTGCGALNRFTDNGNGTVTDECTGLMWQRIDDGVERLWCDALVHCEGLNLGGQSDWRMPNVLELESLVHYGFRAPPMIDPVFEDTAGSSAEGYWTSSSAQGTSSAHVWTVEFNEGGVNTSGDKENEEHLVRAVRGP